MSEEKKPVEAECGLTNQFVTDLFAKEVAEAEALTSAKDLFRKFVELFGARDGKKLWADVAADARDVGGARSGPRDTEMTRQLITFYHHWRHQFPDRPLSELRKACAAQLHAERQGDFGNSVEAIIKRLERLDKGQKPS